ncbi:MAG: nucleoside deaminase [Patescibacteria group bacterium]|nr:nucleoside deaminase [Patescibacteria group bacterium]
MNHPNKKIMERAINLAKEKYKEGGHAVAAIIIKDDEIISEAFTTINKEQDPTCHAEMNAIRKAAKKLHSKVLDNCYLYTTYEPCPMCTSAAIWAKMKGIVYGATRDDQTEKCPWRVYIPASEVIKNGTPKLELFLEFMRAECKELLSL